MRARYGLLAAVAGVLLASAITCIGFSRDLNRMDQQLRAGSTVVPTRHGQIEFTQWGSGPAILVVHGAGGGYDQGRLLADTFGPPGYRWISVSRFGYLRSDLPADASTLAQAEAFADLLDALGIDRVGILAMSGGVPPSLQFAQAYPQRTAALVLLSSAPFTPLTAKVQALPIPAWVYQALFRSDFVFWAIVKLAPAGLDRFFDISPQARAQLSPDDLAFVAGLIEAFLPVTLRTGGLANEGAAIDPLATYDLAAIGAPTLVVHARDDGINPVAIGSYLAAAIAGSDFVEVPKGGHLLLGHIPEVRAQVAAFLHTHLPTAD